MLAKFPLGDCSILGDANLIEGFEQGRDAINWLAKDQGDTARIQTVAAWGRRR